MLLVHSRTFTQKVPFFWFHSPSVLVKARPLSSLAAITRLFHHQTQPLRNQGAPLSPIGNSATVVKNLSPKDELLSSVLGWLGQGAPRPLHLQPVDFKAFENVLHHLSYLGVKPRMDWDTTSHSVTLRVPSELHEVPGGWFAGEALPNINKHLKRVALCGRPSLVSIGSAGLIVGTPTGDGEKGVQPDQSLYLMQVDADGEDVHVQDTPRLIFETSANESRRDIIDKVFTYLFEMVGVHAVVICDLTNVPPRIAQARGATSDATSAKPFKAEIAVWSRKKTGFLDVDYPLDPCYHQEKLGGHDLGRMMTNSWNSTIVRANILAPTQIIQLKNNVFIAAPLIRLYVVLHSDSTIWRNRSQSLFSTSMISYGLVPSTQTAIFRIERSQFLWGPCANA
ncbi:hypothetical protein V565_137830 [Rhizoctonia solani 123E]|uniref:Uncharacterized protein n=1 Tax=Rhizoctonia solani 123E TaxID=1423351 RepID=A0A074SD46_9AGAM|nr:hypothetical protein V565_137830 [Rhizoctonia solani 123E]